MHNKGYYPFEVIQGHRGMYQSKDHMVRISD